MVRHWQVASGLVCLMLASGVEAGFSQSGSLKNLSVGSRSLIDGDRYVSNLTRLRLNPRYRYQDWIVDAAYDLELVSGSFLDSPEFALLRDAPEPRYWDLQGDIHESGTLLARHQFYRGTVQWRSPAGDFRFGRQQVNWSTALIWNPMDILNPVSPLQLEPDERVGVDAILWHKPWGALGRISAVHAPQHNDGEASTAARVKRYIGGVDAGLMAGEFADVTRIGFDGSGSVIGTGWRTEFVWSDPDASDSYWQGVADLNWSFRNGFNLALEYFYNGRPVPPGNSGLGNLLSTDPLYAGRHYTRSTWTPPFSQEIYLTAGAQWFGGNDTSEYGMLEPLGLVEMQWYF